VTTQQPIRPAWRRGVALAVGVILADQATKLAAELLAGGQRHGVLVPLRNPRFSLGLATTTRPLMLLAMAAGIALAAGYGVRATGHGGLPGWIPALVVGGAVSNLADRLLLARCGTSWPSATWSSTSPTWPYWPASSATA
jgi:lipoprotein signal peptidase